MRPTTLVGTYAYVNPFVAVLLGTLVLGEPLGWRTLVGGGIVIAAVALIVRAPKEPAPAQRRARTGRRARTRELTRPPKVLRTFGGEEGATLDP